MDATVMRLTADSKPMKEMYTHPIDWNARTGPLNISG